jgi:hypothetical protein
MFITEFCPFRGVLCSKKSEIWGRWMIYPQNISKITSVEHPLARGFVWKWATPKIAIIYIINN